VEDIAVYPVPAGAPVHPIEASPQAVIEPSDFRAAKA